MAFTVIALVAVIITVLRCSLHKNKHVQKVYTAVKKKLFWTTFIRYLLENFIMLCIAYLIKMYSLKWGDSSESATSAYAIFMVLFLLSAPFFAIVFLFKKFDQGVINDEDFREKYGG